MNALKISLILIFNTFCALSNCFAVKLNNYLFECVSMFDAEIVCFLLYLFFKLLIKQNIIFIFLHNMIYKTKNTLTFSILIDTKKSHSS